MSRPIDKIVIKQVVGRFRKIYEIALNYLHFSQKMIIFAPKRCEDETNCTNNLMHSGHVCPLTDGPGAGCQEGHPRALCRGKGLRRPGEEDGGRGLLISRAPVLLRARQAESPRSITRNTSTTSRGASSSSMPPRPSSTSRTTTSSAFIFPAASSQSCW